MSHNRRPENPFSDDSGENPKKQQKLPPGWDDKRIRDVIAHYENQTEDEVLAEIEASREADDIVLMAIPSALVLEV